jgi:hypothetical protein
MPQSSDYTKITFFRSNTPDAVPTTAVLSEGEIAVNLADRKIYSRNNNDEIVELSGGNNHTHVSEDITDLESVVNNYIDARISNISDLDDVDTTGVADGDTLIYNSTTGNWEPGESGGSDSNSLTNPTKFRYYYLQFIGEAKVGAGTTVALSRVSLYERGAGFINGERWSEGSLINSQVSSATASGDGTNTAIIDLFNETNTAVVSGATTSNNTQKTITIKVDFGEGNARRVTGIDFLYENDDPLYGVKVYASNDDFIDADEIDNGTYTGTLYLLGSWTTDQANNAGVATIGDGDYSPHLALVASNQTVDVEINGSSIGPRGPETLVPDSVVPLGFREAAAGGGALWEFDTTVRTSSFTAEAGKYYFVDTTSGFVGITLPSSPSAGDVVIVRKVAGVSSASFITSDDVEATGSPTVWMVNLPTDSPNTQEQPYAGLVYINATWGWVVFMGAAVHEPV